MAVAKASVKKAAITKPAPYIFKPNLWFAVICGILGFLLYANTIPNRYALDDVMLITQNQFVTEGIKGIPKLFSIDVWHFGNINLGYYRPLSLVTFAIENQFFHLNPHVSHLDNVLLYSLTAFFVCLLLMQMFRKYNPIFSFLITILFLAHPIHTEVVANIKSRDEILSFLNTIIAAYIFLVAVQSSRNALFILSFIFFYLALLSKETAITGVVLMPVILFFGTELTIKQIALKSWPFVALFFAFQYQKFIAIGTLSGTTPHDAVNYPYDIFDAKFPSSFMILMWCVKLVIFPYPLSYNYAYNQLPPTDFSSPETLAGIAIVLVTIYFLVINFNKKTPANFSLLFWSITLAPAMGFVLLKGGILAERMLYAPIVGFSVLAIWLLGKATGINFQSPQLGLKSLLKRIAFSIPVFVILTLYSIDTFSRNKIWYDNLTLYSNDVEVATNSCQTHLHYGMQLIDAGLYEKDTFKREEYFIKSIQQFRISINIRSLNPEAHYGIAWANQVFKGSIDSTIFYGRLAISESDHYYKPYKILGIAYENIQMQRLASYYYNKAVELNPYDGEAVNNLKTHIKNTGLNIKSVLEAENNDSDGSLENNKEYISYRDTGKSFGDKGDFQNALKYLQKAAELKPKSAEALFNLATCYGLMKNYNKCIETLNNMLEIYPNSSIALQSMVTTYDGIGNKAKADEYRKKLAALNNN